MSVLSKLLEISDIFNDLHPNHIKNVHNYLVSKGFKLSGPTKSAGPIHTTKYHHETSGHQVIVSHGMGPGPAFVHNVKIHDDLDHDVTPKDTKANRLNVLKSHFGE